MFTGQKERRCSESVVSRRKSGGTQGHSQTSESLWLLLDKQEEGEDPMWGAHLLWAGDGRKWIHSYLIYSSQQPWEVDTASYAS